MATSCRIGALTAGLARRDVDALTTYGRCFGMLFQLRDDVLDVVATDEELGKPAGQDLAEGIYTLPVLLALRDPATASELEPLLGQPLDQPERDKARAIVAGSPAIAATLDAGRRYATEAAQAAEAVPGTASGRCSAHAGPLPPRRHPRVGVVSASGVIPASGRRIASPRPNGPSGLERPARPGTVQLRR